MKTNYRFSNTMFVRNILRGVYVREGYDGGEDEFLDPVVAVKLSYLINL